MIERRSGRRMVARAVAVVGLMVSAEAMACGASSGGTADRPAFTHPVPGAISQTFGVRLHPLLNTQRAHNGIDYLASTGDPVHAALGGEVVRAGYEGQFGIAVLLRHANGWETFYSRLARLSVKAGDCVKAGEVIAAAGSTGFSTGPGLHFETRKDGAHIDPGSVLPPGREHREQRE